MNKSIRNITIILIVSTLVILGTYLLTKNQTKNLTYPEAPSEVLREKVNTAITLDEAKWTTNNTHDPEIIKVGEWYYVFSTDYLVGGTPQPGIQIRKSKDLIHWEFVGRVFEETTAEAQEWTNGHGTHFWAPEIIEMNQKFYLYYSVSEFGTRNSYIGLATSTSIDGPWTDEGFVFKSREGDAFTVNAIDPSVILDKNDVPWMTYGSYAGGIFLAELDKQTGKFVKPEEEGILIAKRGSKDHEALEGPNLLYNPTTDYYYLSGSYGWLEDTYNVRVGRSKEITGPYVDYNQNPLIDTESEKGSAETGTKIVGPYVFGDDSGWMGTGHNAFLKDGDDYYILHNARAGSDKFWSHLHVRKILWTEDGWPVVSPERYAGEKEQEIDNDHIVGTWEQIILNRFDDGMVASEEISLLASGKINSEDSQDYWELKGSTLLLHWYASNQAPEDYWIDKVKLLPAWDWENWNQTIVFTGLDQNGTAVWGKKQTSPSE